MCTSTPAPPTSVKAKNRTGMYLPIVFSASSIPKSQTTRLSSLLSPCRRSLNV